MSIFKRNLDAFSSKRFVAPTNEYEVEVGVPTYREVKWGTDNIMRIIAVPTRIISDTSGDTEYANKLLGIDFILDLEDESSLDRAIRFVMSCYGIRPGTDEADEEFRQRYGSEDYSVNTENKTLGSGYAKIQKARVIVNVEKTSKNDKEFTKFKGSRPIGD